MWGVRGFDWLTAQFIFFLILFLCEPLQDVYGFSMAPIAEELEGARRGKANVLAVEPSDVVTNTVMVKVGGVHNLMCTRFSLWIHLCVWLLVGILSAQKGSCTTWCHYNILTSALALLFNLTFCSNFLFTNPWPGYSLSLVQQRMPVWQTRSYSGLNAKAKFHYRSLSYAWYHCRLSFTWLRLLPSKGGCSTTLCIDLPSPTSAFWHFCNQYLFNSFLQVIWLECESKVDRPDPCFSSCTAHTHVIKSISLFFHFFQLHSPHPRYKINIFIFYFFQLHSPHPRYKSIYLHVFPAAQIIHRVGQNHKYGVHTVFMAGKLPNKRSHTACIYGSGQPTHTPVRK